ncbi:hypothetical protein CISG_09438 [Coccidioides immitis RMSCC 3703]|uniref:Uncharacterized protein n=1 Tax=Coccidioides immitis RMSCC 3703 TaxID=454286 RepID=A0A0J8QJ40_COCIT|nr:hypothetical protein CISG_09438 [Coccidioides immitis RMSCC 3703]
MRYDGLRCCRLRLLAKKAVRLDKQPKPWAPRKISGPELQVNRQTPALPTSDSWKTKAGFSLSLYNNPSGAQAVINLFFNYYYYYYYYYFYYFLSGLSSYFQLLLFSQRQTTLRLTTLNSYLFNSARHPALKAPLGTPASTNRADAAGVSMPKEPSAPPASPPISGAQVLHRHSLLRCAHTRHTRDPGMCRSPNRATSARPARRTRRMM